MFPVWKHYTYTKTAQGLVKQRLQGLLKLSMWIAALSTAYYLTRTGKGITALPKLMTQYSRMALITLLGSAMGLLERAQGAL